MVEITLNREKYKCPVCKEELTTHQLQRLISEWDFDKPELERDYFQLFGILTNSQFTKLHATSENEVTIWNAIRWFTETPIVWGDVPRVLKIKDRIIDIPQNTQALSIGQNIMVNQAMRNCIALKDDKGNVLEYGNYAYPVAVFLQPIYDGADFKIESERTERVKNLEQELLKMPAWLIRPIGFFLLSNVLTVGKRQENNWLRVKSNQILNSLKALLRPQMSNGLPRIMT